jgi:hypothetical protein
MCLMETRSTFSSLSILHLLLTSLEVFFREVDVAGGAKDIERSTCHVVDTPIFGFSAEKKTRLIKSVY